MATEGTPPECPIYKKWWFGVIAVIVIMAIGRMGKRQHQPTTTQSQSRQEVTKKTEKEKAVTQTLPPNSPDIHVRAFDLVKAYKDSDKKDKHISPIDWTQQFKIALSVILTVI